MGLGTAFREFRFGTTDFHLKLTELVLEDGNESDAAIDDGVFTLVWCNSLRSLMTLLAPNTLWTFANFCGWFLGLGMAFGEKRKGRTRKKSVLSSVLAELKSSSEWSFSLKQNQVLCARFS